MESGKENIVQAVVVMDTFKNNFTPINKTKPMALFPVAGVPLIDYVLESLGLGGVGETILFCCNDGPKIKEHIKKCTKEKVTWSLTMDVQVITSETCQTMGDVMREIDAAGLIRVPPLFADNFDFQTRDDFVNGILINEEILASTVYYKILKVNEYAAAITNWKTYQIISWDILHYWVHPLSIESGSFFQNNYVFMGNHNFRKTTSKLSRSCTLIEDVLIGADTHICDNTTVSKTMIGNNCEIGNNVTLIDSLIEDGTIIVANVNIKTGSKLKGAIIESSEIEENENKVSKSASESGTEWENESDGSGDDEFGGFNKSWSDSESCYSSDSSAQSSLPESPVPEDTNIFLQEVIDSLARGYEEKLKFKDILKFFRPILSNYIKTKSSIMDCLRAIEDSCMKCEWLDGKAGQILHLLYEADVVDEDSLLEWYDDLKDNESQLVSQTSLVKFFEWLQEASEESEDSD
ncbi:unnamed protein product, partial [Iphiclides podalirius]